MKDIIIINETQMATLQMMAADPLDEKLAKRAKIVIGLGSGKKTKEVAAEVGLNKDAVTRWKKRFLKGGVDALYSEHGGGALPDVDIPDLREKINNLISSDPNSTWTRKELAAQLGVSETRVNNELAKMNITLSRNTSWTFTTEDEIKSKCMCIGGLYLSASAKCIVLCLSDKGLISGEESFTTHNRLLADQLKSHDDELTLRDVIWTASDHVQDTWKKKPLLLQEFLDNAIGNLPDESSMTCYAIGLSDEPVQYRGKKPVNLIYQSAHNVEEWNSQVEVVLKELSSPMEQASAIEILNAVKHFNAICKPTTEPIIWTKSVDIAKAVIEAPDIQPEPEPSQLLFSSPEEALASILGPTPENNNSVEVAFITVVRCGDKVLYSTVKDGTNFPDTSAFDLSSPEGFMHGFNQMEKPMIYLRNAAGEAAAKLYVDLVKKNEHDGGVEVVVPVESNLGAIDFSLPPPCADGLRKGTALQSIEFKDCLFGMVKNDSYRITVDNYNRMAYRPVDKEISLSQLTTYVEQEGQKLIAQKNAEAADILSDYDCFDSKGVFIEGAELPEELKPVNSEWITVNAVDIIKELESKRLNKISSLTVDDVLKMTKEELENLFGGPSEPSSCTIRHPMKRRDSRIEITPDEKDERLQSYASWLNSNEQISWNRKLLGQWNIEKDSSQTVRISIDGVLVEEQCKTHVKGGKPEIKSKKTYISHWDMRVDADGKSYFITGLDEEAAYRQLLATLIKNKLINRYLIFFIDGESKINTAIHRYFKPWPHSVYLDFHHLQENLEQYSSSMIITRKVEDPTAEPGQYKRGENAGKDKEPSKISLSRLFAKEETCMAWSGNIVPLAAYIRLIPDKYIKSQEARDKLLVYLKNKEDWITCYRLRRMAGLQNSSNVVELENQLVVSMRQKDDLMAWRDKGSASVAAIAAMYCNREQDVWYDDHRILFVLWQNSSSTAA